jgi:hypothetical protein
MRQFACSEEQYQKTQHQLWRDGVSEHAGRSASQAVLFYVLLRDNTYNKTGLVASYLPTGGWLVSANM